MTTSMYGTPQVVDLSGISAPDNFKTLKSDAYLVTIKSAINSPANSGNPRIALVCEVDGEGVRAYGNVTWHTEAAAGYLKKLAIATGTMPDDGKLNMDNLCGQLADKQFVAHVTPTMFEGRVNHNIRDYWPTDNLTDARRAIADQLRIVGQANGQRQRVNTGTPQPVFDAGMYATAGAGHTLAAQTEIEGL